MERRRFLSVASAVSAALATGCLDPFDTLLKPQRAPSLIPRPVSIGGGSGSVAISQWPFGADAAATISADDLCSLNLGEPYDFGGSLILGDARPGTLEDFIFNRVLRTYPRVRFSFYTIAAMKLDPRTNSPLSHAARLTESPDWCGRIRELQATYPGFVLGWHGYSHWNDRIGGPTEFVAYDDVQTQQALNSMESVIVSAGVKVTRGFRPPGWGITNHLLDELGARSYILADNSSLPTYSGIQPGYIRTPAGQWLFRIGVTFTMTPAEAFAAGGMYVVHNHMTPPNVNALGDQAVRDRILRFISIWYDSTDPQIAWLSPDDVREAYDQAAGVSWTAALDGSKATIEVQNPESLRPGITWQVRSSDVTDVEIYAHSQKTPNIVTQRPGLLTVYLT
jgi:hypothetical protein